MNPDYRVLSTFDRTISSIAEFIILTARWFFFWPCLSFPLQFWGVIFEKDSRRGNFLRRACILIFSGVLLLVGIYKVLLLGFFPPRLAWRVAVFLNFVMSCVDELYFAYWELTGWRGIIYKYFVFLVFNWTVFSPVHAAVAWFAGRAKGRSRLDLA